MKTDNQAAAHIENYHRECIDVFLPVNLPCSLWFFSLQLLIQCIVNPDVPQYPKKFNRYQVSMSKTILWVGRATTHSPRNIAVSMSHQR
jgi:hypothetical protein